MNTIILLVLLATISNIKAFIPHPAVKWFADAKNSLTHSEMTQLGFTRALARFFLETRLKDINNGVDIANFTADHDIDSLYKLAYPEWGWLTRKTKTWSLKRMVDLIQTNNVIVDLNPSTKNLPSAHFDAELFAESNRRIMNMRGQVISDAKNSKTGILSTPAQIGGLLHTLQDFYSHSNWVEMGKTEINDRIGLYEDIGPVADSNQATCLRSGCTKTISECTLLQRVYAKCPLQYYDCRDNIVPEINQQGLLTSGYVSDQKDENKNPVTKPKNIDKCSHGSILDSSSHELPVGGINKDAATVLFSPHYYLHRDAAKLAVEATDHFFDTLRKELGNRKFSEVFSITPSDEQLDIATYAIEHGERFHFYTPRLSINLDKDIFDLDKIIRERNEALTQIAYGLDDPELPTFDVSDIFNETDSNGIHTRNILEKNTKNLQKKHFHHRRIQLTEI